jgi:hypothetical protein
MRSLLIIVVLTVAGQPYTADLLDAGTDTHRAFCISAVV